MSLSVLNRSVFASPPARRLTGLWLQGSPKPGVFVSRNLDKTQTPSTPCRMTPNYMSTKPNPPNNGEAEKKAGPDNQQSTIRRLTRNLPNVFSFFSRVTSTEKEKENRRDDQASGSTSTKKEKEKEKEKPCDDPDFFPANPAVTGTSHDARSKKELEDKTRELLGRFFSEYAGLSERRWFESKEVATLKRMVDEILKDHKPDFSEMIRLLELRRKGDDVAYVTYAARLLFKDVETSWERIIVLVAFGACVCQHMVETDKSCNVELVAKELSDYFLSEHSSWLLDNGGWKGMVEEFADPSQTAWRKVYTAMAVVGVTGVAASVAWLFK